MIRTAIRAQDTRWLKTLDEVLRLKPREEQRREQTGHVSIKRTESIPSFQKLSFLLFQNYTRAAKVGKNLDHLRIKWYINKKNL